MLFWNKNRLTPILQQICLVFDKTAKNYKIFSTQGSQFVGEAKNSTGVKRHKVVHVTPTRDISGVQAAQQAADEAATFVTPGIFRRKLSKQKQPKTNKEGQNDAKENREVSRGF